MYKFLVAAALAGAIVLPCAAVETKFWQQDDQSVFERGTFKNISIRSDGRLTLAPRASGGLCVTVELPADI